MFDKKPLIVQPWCASLEIKKTDVERVPIWIRLPDLELKYWGVPSLMKIAGLIGKPIKADRATTEREMLSFSRVMVEVNVKQELPDVVEFVNEWGYNKLQEVKYEWKPIHCTNCGGMGHDAEKCRRVLGTRRIWIAKCKGKQKQQLDIVVDDGFTRPKDALVTSTPRNTDEDQTVHTCNPFQLLSMGRVNDMAANNGPVATETINQTGKMVLHSGGGEPPLVT